MSKTEKTPKLRSSRVDRGGSWSSGPQFARVAHRESSTPGITLSYVGVRLVEVLDEQD